MSFADWLMLPWARLPLDDQRLRELRLERATGHIFAEGGAWKAQHTPWWLAVIVLNCVEAGAHALRLVVLDSDELRILMGFLEGNSHDCSKWVELVPVVTTNNRLALTHVRRMAHLHRARTDGSLRIVYRGVETKVPVRASGRFDVTVSLAEIVKTQ